MWHGCRSEEGREWRLTAQSSRAQAEGALCAYVIRLRVHYNQIGEAQSKVVQVPEQLEFRVGNVLSSVTRTENAMVLTLLFRWSPYPSPLWRRVPRGHIYICVCVCVCLCIYIYIYIYIYSPGTLSHRLVERRRASSLQSEAA